MSFWCPETVLIPVHPGVNEELHAFCALLMASGQAKQPQATKVIFKEAIQRFGDLDAEDDLEIFGFGPENVGYTPNEIAI